MISTLADTRSSRLPSSSENAMLMVKNSPGATLCASGPAIIRNRTSWPTIGSTADRAWTHPWTRRTATRCLRAPLAQLHPPRVRAIPGVRHLDFGDAGEQLVRERDGAVLGWQRPLGAPGDGGRPRTPTATRHTAATPRAAKPSSGLSTKIKTRSSSAVRAALTTATVMPLNDSLMNEIPSTALASSPELVERKNATGSRMRRSHSASWVPFSILPSTRSRCRFCTAVESRGQHARPR